MGCESNIKILHSYAKQILPVSTFTDSSGFKIGWSLPEIFKIKVDTPTAGHPVVKKKFTKPQFEKNSSGP